MGYYAKIWTGDTTEISGVTIQHNEVLDVIIVDECNLYLLTGNTILGTWLRTCPQCWIRKNYAGAGMIYDEENDMFIKKQPYPSWSANTETGIWEPPTPEPGPDYYWDEDTLSWIELPFPTPSPTPSISITPSVTPSVTPSISVSPTPGLSPTPTVSPSVTPT